MVAEGRQAEPSLFTALFYGGDAVGALKAEEELTVGPVPFSYVGVGFGTRGCDDQIRSGEYRNRDSGIDGEKQPLSSLPFESDGCLQQVKRGSSSLSAPGRIEQTLRLSAPLRES